MSGSPDPARRQALALLTALLVCAGFLCWLVGRPLVRFVSDPAQLRLWVDTYGLWAKVAFVGIVTLQVILAVIPGEPVEIAAGFAFGAVEGTVLCLLGIALGSGLVLLITRRLGHHFAGLFFSQEKLHSLRFLKTARRRNGLLFLLNFLPGTPKDLLSYFAGFTDIPMGQWLWLVTVARIPSVVTSTLGGNALGLRNYETALLVFGVTLAISALGFHLYRRICRLHEEDSTPPKS